MITTDSNIIENMKILAEIREKNPSASHVYVQRYKNGIDVGWVDIPIAHAEMTIRQNPAWKLLTSNKQMDDEVEKLFSDESTVTAEDMNSNEPGDILVVPPRPSEEAAAVETSGTPTDPEVDSAAPSADTAPKPLKTTKPRAPRKTGE